MNVRASIRRQLRPILVALGLLAALGAVLLLISMLSEPQARPAPVIEARTATAAPPTELPLTVTETGSAAVHAATPCWPTPTPVLTPTRTPLPLQPGDLNVLLLGCDDASKDGSWRTDTIVVVAIRPRAGFVAMFSVPRDLYVEIPGHGYSRINTADYRGQRIGWPGGGPGLVGDTLLHNLGIPVHAYVRIDFQGLVRIIDTLGGITVDVDQDYPDARLVAGVQHLDGAAALAYARSRETTNDLDRTRRQQQVLLAMRDAALRPAMLLQLPALIDALFDTVDTDLDPGQVLSLASLARRLDPGDYRARTFDATMVSDWTTPTGGMVLLYDRARVEDVWAELTRVDTYVR